MGKSKKKSASSSTTGGNSTKEVNVIMKQPVSEIEAKRRLDPIDKAISMNQSKQAIKLCNHALTKRPGWPSARALKAVAILKQTNSRASSLQIMKSIISDIESNRVPLDNDACEKISFAYKELRLPDMVANIREKLWLQNMSVIENGESTYSCFICAHMFEQARKTALRLMRLKTWKTSSYTILMGCAVWLEITMKVNSLNNSSELDDRLLKVSSMQIAKVIIDGDDLPQREMVHFAARLFIDASMFEQAKKLLIRSKLVMGPKENLVLLANVCRKAGEVNEATKCYREIVTQIEPDDWQCWIHYINCVDKDGGVDTSTQLWETLSNCCSTAEKHVTRGPFLARMEMLLREKRTEELRDEVVSFFGMFSSRPRCRFDLRRYVKFLVSLNAQDNLFDLLKVATQETNGGVTSHVNYCWLRLWCDCLDESVDDLVKFYNAELDKNETCIDADDYLILAAHKLLPISENRYKNKRNILKAIILLEYGFGRSLHGTQFKLLLTVLYMELKYTERAYALWLSLDIKPIQAPSMAFLVLEPLFSMANYNDLHALFLLFEGYWFQIDSDLPKSISVGLSNEKFNATANLVLFRHRQARFAVLARAVAIQAFVGMAQGDAGGMDSAWKLVADGSRFPCGEKEWREGLTFSSDDTVMDFWNEWADDDVIQVDEHDETGAELGALVPRDVQNTIFETLKGVRRVIAVVKGVESGVVDMPDEDFLKANSSNVTANDESAKNVFMPDSSVTPEEVSRATFVQSFTRLLVDLEKALSRCGKSAGEANGNVVSDLEGWKVQVEGLCAYIAVQTAAIVSGLTDVKASNYLENVPYNVGECGNFLGAVLVLVVLGVEKLGVVVAQKMKGVKKSGGAEEIGMVENMVTDLKRETMASCGKLAKTLSVLGEMDHVERVIEWLDVDKLLPFLPEQLRLVRVGDDGDSMLDHEGYVGNILGNIVESHKNAAQRMLLLVNKLIRKLN